MPGVANSEMGVEEFLVWAEGREGRWELRDGRAGSDVAGARGACADEICGSKGDRRGDRPRRTALPHVSRRHDRRISARTAFEPDALVVCPPPPLDAIEIPNPVIVVEVLSPSTAADDHGVKFDGYFSLPSVEHYLILDPDRRVMIHHKRGPGAIETRILRDGSGSIRSTGSRGRGGGVLPVSEGLADSRRFAGQMQRPPSTSRTTPVRNEASSLAR